MKTTKLEQQWRTNCSIFYLQDPDLQSSSSQSVAFSFLFFSYSSLSTRHPSASPYPNISPISLSNPKPPSSLPSSTSFISSLPLQDEYSDKQNLFKERLFLTQRCGMYERFPAWLEKYTPMFTTSFESSRSVLFCCEVCVLNKAREHFILIVATLACTGDNICVLQGTTVSS
ncbi:hypothetical protein DKX38_028044 [Salix brachista]|uniref:Uncharacterized protein n=1 Tax=Salix brachista TaxID=2182728 RepID=A0A5N5J4J6_9ROSI|nr:hypothetical protein DKX38_028044 [Salix brachista]